MQPRSLDLWAVGALAAVSVSAQAYALPAPLRAVSGLALVGVCPGYAWVAAFFASRRLGWPERAALSLGLSLALAALGAVALNLTPWGLQAVAWAGLLGGLTLSGSLIAAARRLQTAPAFTPVRRSRPTLRASQWVLLALAALVTTSAGVVARTPAPAAGVEGYTVLWLTPATASEAGAVSLGVDSSELAPTSYMLTLTVAGAPVQAWPDLTLAPGEHWTQVVALPAGVPGEAVEAKLYRRDTPDRVYRWVRWWRTETTGDNYGTTHTARQ